MVDKSSDLTDPVDIGVGDKNRYIGSIFGNSSNVGIAQGNGIVNDKSNGKVFEETKPLSNEMDKSCGAAKSNALNNVGGNDIDRSKLDQLVEEHSRFLCDERKLHNYHRQAERSGGMREVLFYGDSLTWGMSHNYTGRYKVTWPQLIESNIRSYGFGVVENALCSRTTLFDDEGDNQWMTGGEPHYFNGLRHFSSIFGSHSVRVLVILLGTNDLKERIRTQAKFRVDANLIAKNCIKIAHKAQEIHQIQAAHRRFFRDIRNKNGRLNANANEQKSQPNTNDNANDENKLDIVIVAPPVVVLNQISQKMGYDETSVRISIEFPDAFRSICDKYGYHIVSPEIDMSQSMDGVHITEESGKVIADHVWKVLEKLLIKANENRKPIIEKELPTASNDQSEQLLPPPPPPEQSLFKIPPHAFESIFDSFGYEITIPSIPLHQFPKTISDITNTQDLVYLKSLIQTLINERHLTLYQVAQEAGIRSVNLLQQFLDKSKGSNDVITTDGDELYSDVANKSIKWYKWVVSHALVVGAVSGRSNLPSSSSSEAIIPIPEGKPPITNYLEVDESVYLGDGVPERIYEPKPTNLDSETMNQDDNYGESSYQRPDIAQPERFVKRSQVGGPLPEAEACRSEIKKFIAENYSHLKNVSDECKVHSYSLKRWLNSEFVHQPSVYLAGRAVYNWYMRIKSGASNDSGARRGDSEVLDENNDNNQLNGDQNYRMGRNASRRGDRNERRKNDNENQPRRLGTRLSVLNRLQEDENEKSENRQSGLNSATNGDSPLPVSEILDDPKSVAPRVYMSSTSVPNENSNYDARYGSRNSKTEFVIGRSLDSRTQTKSNESLNSSVSSPNKFKDNAELTKKMTLIASSKSSANDKTLGRNVNESSTSSAIPRPNELKLRVKRTNGEMQRDSIDLTSSNVDNLSQNSNLRSKISVQDQRATDSMAKVQPSQKRRVGSASPYSRSEFVYELPTTSSRRQRSQQGLTDQRGSLSNTAQNRNVGAVANENENGGQVEQVPEDESQERIMKFFDNVKRALPNQHSTLIALLNSLHGANPHAIVSIIQQAKSILASEPALLFELEELLPPHFRSTPIPPHHLHMLQQPQFPGQQPQLYMHPTMGNSPQGIATMHQYMSAMPQMMLHHHMQMPPMVSSYPPHTGSPVRNIHMEEAYNPYHYQPATHNLYKEDQVEGEISTNNDAEKDQSKDTDDTQL